MILAGSRCGEENPSQFRLCGFCGAALKVAVDQAEKRKLVTVVFSDLKGSTALGGSLEAEAVREVMSRYFDAMKAELVRHGGPSRSTSGAAIAPNTALDEQAVACLGVQVHARQFPARSRAEPGREIHHQLGDDLSGCRLGCPVVVRLPRRQLSDRQGRTGDRATGAAATGQPAVERHGRRGVIRASAGVMVTDRG